jgi:hypothetical protein
LNTKVVSFGCGPWRWYKGVGEIHMNKGRVGEERRGKETDGCPLTLILILLIKYISKILKVFTVYIFY